MTDEVACHRCDNPSCVNPEHLFIGSHLENKMDAVRKGRAARGEYVGTSVLTEAQVIAIARAYGTNFEIADAHKVHRNTVALIRCGKSWSHLTGIQPHNRKTRMAIAA